MRTERAPRADAGFTILEVLIAMVILAVGLLALESMGIGASRMVARARHQSTYAALASDTLERTINRIRAKDGSAVAQSWQAAGADFTLTVGQAAVGATGMDVWDVTVTVTPDPAAGSGYVRATDGITLRSNVLVRP